MRLQRNKITYIHPGSFPWHCYMVGIAGLVLLFLPLLIIFLSWIFHFYSAYTSCSGQLVQQKQLQLKSLHFMMIWQHVLKEEGIKSCKFFFFLHYLSSAMVSCCCVFRFESLFYILNTHQPDKKENNRETNSTTWADDVFLGKWCIRGEVR